MESTPSPKPTSDENFVTFKRSHFYSVLVVLAFGFGILLGYIVWGRATPAQPTTVAAEPQTITIVVTPTASPVPPPVVYDIPTDGFPSLGPEDAPITIVEFSDYQCPYCKRWHDEVYQNLLNAYPGKIRFVYRNYPLSFHQNAFNAAEAALCAGDQNAYWPYHDKLFAENDQLNNQDGSVLGPEVYEQFAADLDLDVTAFGDCLTSEKYKDAIQKDMAFANSLPPDNTGEPGVGGTPTFFINGHRLGGAYPLVYFQQIIDSELSK